LCCGMRKPPWLIFKLLDRDLASRVIGRRGAPNACQILHSQKQFVQDDDCNKKGALSARPKEIQRLTQRLKPVACIAFREISLVEEIPCMRSLKSSALDAFSSAVS
jgi:hypothetical protein